MADDEQKQAKPKRTLENMGCFYAMLFAAVLGLGWYGYTQHDALETVCTAARSGREPGALHIECVLRSDALTCALARACRD